MPTNVDRWFTYSHLQEEQQRIVRHFAELMEILDNLVPDCAEKSAGARKLLEAKDCFVRASFEERNHGF